jgi:TonB family protein
MRSLMFYLAALFLAAVPPTVFEPPVDPPFSIAVLDLGTSLTGQHTASAIKASLMQAASPAALKFVDRDLSAAAARGSGYFGSLNLTLPQARDLGAAIGCDFIFAGDSQTLHRLPSDGSSYFESYAAIFLISARTGKLVLWERLAEQRPLAADAEKALLDRVASAETAQRYLAAIERTIKVETLARQTPPEAVPVIEEVSDNENSNNNGLRLPRPYRSLKPPYPDSAAVSEVAATVDALVDIDVKGEVSQIEIVRWAGYGLDESVIDTVRQLHFVPAMRSGVAIPLRVLLRYNFRKPPPTKTAK